MGRVIIAAAAFLASVTAASAQPVTARTTCGEFSVINPEFLTNIMTMDIQAGMSGTAGNNSTANAAWLNKFVGLPGGRTGDAGINAARQIEARMNSGFGGPREPELLAAENRARAKAVTLLPTLGNFCNMYRTLPLLDMMLSVLVRAGYARPPGGGISGGVFDPDNAFNYEHRSSQQPPPQPGVAVPRLTPADPR